MLPELLRQVRRKVLEAVPTETEREECSPPESLEREEELLETSLQERPLHESQVTSLDVPTPHSRKERWEHPLVLRVTAAVQSPCDHVHLSLQQREMPLTCRTDVEEWPETPEKQVLEPLEERQLELQQLEQSPQTEPESSSQSLEPTLPELSEQESLLQPECQLELVPQRSLPLLWEPSECQSREPLQESRELRVHELPEQHQRQPEKVSEER